MARASVRRPRPRRARSCAGLAAALVALIALAAPPAHANVALGSENSSTGTIFAVAFDRKAKLTEKQLRTWIVSVTFSNSFGHLWKKSAPDYGALRPTDAAVRNEMVAKGWLAEGDGPDLVVMCAPQ